MKNLGRKMRVLIAAIAAAGTLVTSATAASTAVASTRWSETPSIHIGGDSTMIQALVSTGPHDIWAFGSDYSPTLGEWRAFGERWNGSTWTRLNLPDRETTPAEDLLYGAAAGGVRSVWAVGSSSTAVGQPRRRDLIERWDVQTWTIVDPILNVGLSRELIGVAESVSRGRVGGRRRDYPRRPGLRAARCPPRRRALEQRAL